MRAQKPKSRRKKKIDNDQRILVVDIFWGTAVGIMAYCLPGAA
jgi:hypothetical protein